MEDIYRGHFAYISRRIRGDAFQSTVRYVVAITYHPTLSSQLKGASSSPRTLRSLRKAGPRTPVAGGDLALKLEGP